MDIYFFSVFRFVFPPSVIIIITVPAPASSSNVHEVHHIVLWLLAMHHNWAIASLPLSLPQNRYRQHCCHALVQLLSVGRWFRSYYTIRQRHEMKFTQYYCVGYYFAIVAAINSNANHYFCACCALIRVESNSDTCLTDLMNKENWKPKSFELYLLMVVDSLRVTKQNQTTQPTNDSANINPNNKHQIKWWTQWIK